MKILDASHGTYETIHVDTKPLDAGWYIRFSSSEWYHKIDRNGGTWLFIYDPATHEDAYKEWKKKTSK